MKLFKFIIPPDDWRASPDNPDLQWAGCIALTVAENVAEAREQLERYAQEHRLNPLWTRVADVIEIPIVNGTVAAWAQV